MITRRTLLGRCISGVLALLLTPAVQAESSARAQLDSFLAEVKSFHAAFEQQLYDEYGEPLETAQGQVDIARPGRFNWSYESPYRQRLVSDGKTLWVYDADLEQVTINEVDLGKVDSPGRLLGDEVDVDQSFTVAELPAKDGVEWLKLTPKSADQQFNEIELGLRDGTVVAMRLKDNLGQTTEITFTGIDRNAPTDPKAFIFEPPAGIDVIHGAGS